MTRFIVSVLCLCGLCGIAAAQNYGNGATNVFTWLTNETFGNSSTFKPGTMSAPTAAKWELVTDGGPVTGKSSGRLPINGANLPVTVTGHIPPSSMAKALGKFASRGLPLVGTGTALWELAKELGFGLSRNGDGDTVFSKETSEFQCDTTGGGISYTTGNGSTTPYPQFLAEAAPDGRYSCTATQLTTPTSCSPGVRCSYTSGSYHVDFPNVIWATKPAGTIATAVPVTRQEFEDAIAAKSGWPSTSRVAEALKQAIQAGNTVEVVPATVTGPASTPGAKTVVNNGNTTTTNQTTNNYTYEGAKVTVSTTNVSTTVNNSTGATVGSPVVTESAPEIAPEKEPEPEEPATDTALPQQPVLYTPIYPDGLVGVWAQKKAQLASTSLVGLVSSLMPSVSSSGSCPTMMINLNYASWANFGSHDVAPPCAIWEFGKIVIILSALLLARALVFGG